VNEKRSRLKPSNLDKFVFLHANMYKENEEAISWDLTEAEKSVEKLSLEDCD
jgi:hypothetical protein